MGRYIAYDPDLLGRYPSTVDVNSPANVGSNWIAYAENAVDGYLGTHFDVPFNSSNLTVRDITLEIAWAKMGLLNAEEAETILKAAYERMDRLKAGDEVMVSASGTILAVTVAGQGFTTTSGYQQCFGPDDPMDWGYTSGYLQDFQDLHRD